eukprot:80423-Pleurochrysis_carterae.AAC.1
MLTCSRFCEDVSIFVRPLMGAVDHLHSTSVLSIATSGPMRLPVEGCAFPPRFHSRSAPPRWTSQVVSKGP